MNRILTPNVRWAGYEWTLRSHGGSRSWHVIAPKPTATRLPQPGKPREIPSPSNPPLKLGRNRWPLGIPSRAACAHAAKKPFLVGNTCTGESAVMHGSESVDTLPKPGAYSGPHRLRPSYASHFEVRGTPIHGAASIALTREFTTPEFRKLPKDSKLASQLPVMIAGNPKSCRTIAACAVVLVLLIVVSTALIAMRKRTAPLKVVPLHPSTFMLSNR
jgi:hypothetical protein